MTYGSLPEVRHPDPALQPLIHLGRGRIAMPLVLHTHTSPERNHLVLLNQLTEEKKIYARLVAEKEEVMRAQILRELPEGILGRHCRSQEGRPEVDLLLWSPNERRAAAIELKWFIRPAEIREILAKDEELSKGVEQAREGAAALRNSEPWRRELFGDSSDWQVDSIVVSKNWIGYGHVQAHDVPIITEPHFLAKLTGSGSLGATLDWLAERRYLPVQGVHFELYKTQSEVRGVAVPWYGLKPLIAGGFQPL
jgi:hypothetical protein